MPARRPLLRALFAALIAAAMVLPAPAPGSSDSVEFTVVPGPVGYGGPQGVAEPPGVPAATPLGVSDRPESLADSISTRMGDFAVTDASGSGLGWSITVSGDKGRDRSPVLRQYCPSSACGGHPGPGYVPDGHTFPPNSLTLDSSGARFRAQSPGSAEPPANTCTDVCFIDTPAATPSKVAVAEVDAGMGAFKASGFSEESFRLVAPSNPAELPRNGIYRVDVSWSLNTGP